MDRKAAGVGEGVEDPLAAREAPEQPAVRALVEEEAGLLPAAHVDEKARTPLGDLDALGRIRAVGDPAAVGQALLAARTAGRALEDAIGPDRRREGLEDLAAQPFGAGRQQLQDGVATVHVDHHARQAVALAVH